MTKGVQIDKEIAAELQELRQMKKAHERLKLEHEILKQAIEFTSVQKARSFAAKHARIVWAMLAKDETLKLA